MKDTISYIKTENRIYPMVFNLNVMEEIQETYGSMAQWGELIEGGGEPRIKDLKAGLGAMINEAIDIENETREEKQEFVSLKQVGRILTEVGITQVAQQIQELTIESTDTGEESKNE